MMKSVQSTSVVVAAERVCPRCGAKLGGFGPEGLCGACMIGSALDEEPDFELPGPASATLPRFGDYEFLEEIARGGMGIVYRARQTSLNRTVAIKLMLGGPSASAEEIRRFRVEAEAAAQLKHPNIVAIHEVGEHDRQPFFSMDFIEGRTLRQLTQDDPLPAQKAAGLLKTIAEAVHYAHERGVVHRDLKPSNVLVDAAGQPHITDFGLAKRIDTEAEFTLSGVVMGTPSYMPPEQAAGLSKTVGPLADVYALGAVLYDLLTGRPPFRAATPIETMAQAMHEEPVAPRQLNPSVPRDLETICLKCLEKAPSHRYASAAALAEDLARWLNHEPIEARPSSTWYRAAKWARRRPAQAALFGTIFLALVAISVISTTLSLRARRAEGLATKRLNEVTAERNQKEQARQAAEAAREEAEGISRFLVQVFQSSNPDVKSGGWTNTVAASLDAAVVKLEKDVSLHPERRAKLRDVIGDTYHGLGLYPEAIALLEKVMAYRQASLGPEHLDTLEAMTRLGNSYYEGGRLEEAQKLREEVLTLRRKILGSEHRDTLRAMRNLAISYKHVGRQAEALNLREEALTVSRKLLGPEHPDTLAAMDHLAGSYADGGRRGEALKLQEEVLTVGRRVLGPEHREIFSAMHNLATSYHQAGRREEGLKLLEEVLMLMRKLVGPEHSETFDAMYDLATMYHDAGRREEALALRQEVLTLRRKVLGSEHPATLKGMEMVAISYHDVGRREEALKLREETLTLCRKALGSEHPDTLNAVESVAVSYHDAGRREEALDLQEEVLTLRLKRLGPENLDTITAMSNLASWYGHAGRREEALKLREEVLTHYRKVLEPEDPKTLLAMNNLANSYSDAGRGEEALKLREEVLTLYRKVLGPEDPKTLMAMNNLANSYSDAGRREEALKLQEDVLTLCRKRLGPEDPKTIGAMINLAVLYDAGRLDEALKLREQVLALRRKVLGPEHPDTLETMYYLATAYEKAGRLDDARKLREERTAVQAHGHNASPRVTRAGTAGSEKYARADASYRQKQFAEADALYREVWQSQLRQFPATNESCLQTAASLARNLADWAWADHNSTNAAAAYDHALEGERLLRDCLEARTNGIKTASWRVADVKSRLGFARLVLAITDHKLTPETRATRFTDSEPLLFESAAALQAESRVSSIYKRDALERLVRLYEAWNKPDKLAEWKQKLEAFDKAQTATRTP